MTDRGLLEVIVQELRAIRQAVERQAPQSGQNVPSAACRYADLLLAIAEACGAEGLPFEVCEVLRDADSNDDLAEALRESRIADTSELGAALRSLRNKRVEGFVLRRDGRQWRIDRDAP